MIFGQYAVLRYDTQPVRNADRSIIGAAYAQVFAGAYSPALFFSLYGGEEMEVDKANPHLGHKPVGVRVGGEVRMGGGWSAFGGVAYEYRKYNGPDPLFLVEREDNQAGANLGLSYLWRAGATLRLQALYINNDSNIVLNEYDRTEISIATRLNF